MMLGASLAQLPGIHAAHEMGHEVITCDNQPASVGHEAADAAVFASTFDPDAVCEAARHQRIDGIMTMGTDQPVLTAAIVAEALGLPSMLDVQTARAVTDKRMMKRLFTQLGIPTVAYAFFKKSDPLSVLAGLTGPVVVKPVDSQGQRGIFVLPSPGAVVDRIDDVLAYSRTDEILVESFYPNEEVTVSGWVHEGQTTILSITDRVTFPEIEHLGICLSHELPSKQMDKYGRELIMLTREIVLGFGIRNGPIYFQYLIGDDGIRVNEIACRIGGAFESQFLPSVTGFDLTRAQVRSSFGLELDPQDKKALECYDCLQVQQFLSVQLFFAQPCTIGYLTPLSDVLACEGVVDAGYHRHAGQQIASIKDATARVGFCIVTAGSQTQLEDRLRRLYEVLVVRDSSGINRILHRKIADPMSHVNLRSRSIST